MGYLDFLDLLLEEEVGLREGRRFRNALKLSGLPHHKTLDEFDFAFQPDLDARKVRDLATLEFVQAKSNVALLGPPGVGKTMLAVALAVARLPGRLLDLLHQPRRPGPPAPRRRGHRPVQPATRRPTCDPPSWSSTRSATCRWTAPKPTWSSSSSPAATNAAP